LGNLQATVKPSLVVSDPKGELFRDTAHIAIREGYQIYRFNTIDVKNSDT
jgi:type IV secretory pathway TraG/TraD family ATPase VirD4